MKRCPQCNRFENDEALVFCRKDGTPLVADSSSTGSEAGTAQLSSKSGANEFGTSVLPHTTNADFSRKTGPIQFGGNTRSNRVIARGYSVFVEGTAQLNPSRSCLLKTRAGMQTRNICRMALPNRLSIVSHNCRI